MGQVLNANDAGEQLKKLLEAVERGEEVTIEREGVPCARIVPAGPRKVRELGFLAGTIPPIPDSVWFEPVMTDEELDEWENDDYTGPRYQTQAG